MNTKIRYTYEPIEEILRDIAIINNNNIGNLFGKIANLLKNSNIKTAWEETIEKSENNFSKEDKSIIKSMGKMLGKTDVEGQLSEIKQCIEFIEIQIEKAEKERQKNEKLYKTLGMVMGAAIVIILI